MSKILLHLTNKLKHSKLTAMFKSKLIRLLAVFLIFLGSLSFVLIGKINFLARAESSLPTCTGVNASSVKTYETSGLFDVYAEGVKNADLVWFAAWSEDNGQDDLAWYSGEKKADELWVGHLDLARHADGQIIVMGFANTQTNPTPGMGATCGATSFTKIGWISVDNPAPAKFNEVHPSSSTTKDISGNFEIIATGAVNTEMIWFGAWSLNGGIDDLVWYKGEKRTLPSTSSIPGYLEEVIWVGKIDLSRHTGIDTIFVRACAVNTAFPQINADTVCRDTNFQRIAR